MKDPRQQSTVKISHSTQREFSFVQAKRTAGKSGENHAPCRPIFFRVASAPKETMSSMHPSGKLTAEPTTWKDKDKVMSHVEKVLERASPP